MDDSTCCLHKSMSSFQPIKAEISQLPRLVMLRMFFRPGTRLMAFSSGLVTVIIILLTGCKPLSAMTLIFGKVTSGKSDDCILLYEKIPAAKMINNTTATGFLWETKKLFMAYG